MEDLNQLVSLIAETQHYFKHQAQRQVNTALTLRNWLFGLYIAEYELNGADRAIYGQKVLKEIARRTKHISGMSERSLYLFKSFYLAYPQILQSLTAKSYFTDFQDYGILQAATAKFFSIQKNDAEMETISNSWSVRELQRAMNIMLYERTGLSTNKQAAVETERLIIGMA